jgi:hypothetical protein
MKTSHVATILLTCVVACGALSVEAADRMRAGQWVGTWTGAGRTQATSTCMARSDVDAMNGDVKSIQTYLEKTIPPTICKLSDIKVKGNDVIYTSICAGGKANVITTTYHGDSFESTDSTGAKSEAKWVGACK